MTRFLYTQEHIDFLRSIASGTYATDITEVFNKHFGLCKTVGQIKSCMKHNKIYNGMWHKPGNPAKKNKLISFEQIEIIRNNFDHKGGSWNDVIVFCSEQFGINLTKNQVKRIMTTNKIILGHNGRFKKGHVPASKGQKMPDDIRERIKHTFFQKGHIPHNRLPIGSEVVSTTGYVVVKVDNLNVWRPKSHILWEEATGEKLLPDERIIYCDGNKLNLDLDNLAKVNMSELSILNKNGKITEFSELTKTNLCIIRLSQAIKRRSKG